MHATVSTQAAHRRWFRARPELGPLLRDPRAQVLAVTFGIVLVLIAMVMLNVAGLAAVWENGHWTVASIGATAAAVIGARRATGLDRTLRSYAAVSLGMCAIGSFIWDLEVLIGTESLASVADAFWLGSLVPLALGLRCAVRDRFSLVDRRTTYLDSIIVFTAVLGLVLLIVGPTAAAQGDLTGFLLIAYPTVLIATIGIIVLLTANLRIGPRPIGATAILIGFLMLVAAQTLWTLEPEGALNSATDVGTIPNTLWSLAILVLGVGGATLSHREFSDRSRRQLAVLLQNGLPVAALAVAASLMLIGPEIVNNPMLTETIEFSVATVVALTAVRQWALLADRSRSLKALQLANDEMAEARRELAAAGDAARAVGEQRQRALDAGRLLLLQDDFAGALTSVLHLVLPGGAIGLICEANPETHEMTVLAAAGPGSGSLAGRVADSRVLAQHLGSNDGEPVGRAYSATGRPLPPDIERTAFAFEWVVPEAGATLMLPLLSSDGHSLGYICVIDVGREDIIEPTFVSFVSLVANQLAVAFQNRLLVERLRAELAERLVMQDRLVQASKLTAIGVLAAGVAHEVNNPLTGVLGYSDLLLAQGIEDDEVREGLEVIRGEALRARDIVRALLEFARPSPPERHPADLRDLINSTLALMRFHIERPSVVIVEDHEPLPLVNIDANVIRQVLLNLLNNAVQAVPDHGLVTISTRLRGKDAVIAVVDDGVGMTEEVRQRIFDPFFTTRAAENGHGLGMSVSLGIVKAHGGTIHVDSEPGRGTRVEVTLPLEIADEAPAEPVLIARRRHDRPSRDDGFRSGPPPVLVGSPSSSHDRRRAGP